MVVNFTRITAFVEAEVPLGCLVGTFKDILLVAELLDTTLSECLCAPVQMI